MTEHNCDTLTARRTALDDLAQYDSSDDEFEDCINSEITDEITQYTMVQSINPSLPPTTGWNVVNNGIAPLPTLTFLDNGVDEKPTTSQKLYHGTIKHPSTCVDHTFWGCSPHFKLQNKWYTHLPVSIYCNNHVQHDNNTFICLGHTNQADFISAQKEWEKNGWNDELVTSENVDTIKMSLHIEEKVEKRVITYVPPSTWSYYLSGKPDVPPSDFNADEKTEWERQKREYHQPKVRKSDLIAKNKE